jgi:hypothetical protein
MSFNFERTFRILYATFVLTFSSILSTSAWAQGNASQGRRSKQEIAPYKSVPSERKVVLPDSMSLIKVYPFRPTNDFYVSALLTVPLKTHTAANGFAAFAGLRRGLFDFYVGLLKETRAWRQLEQRQPEEAYVASKGEFTADDPDKEKVSRHLLKFQWSSSDLFSLWSFDAGFGLRYPAPFLSDNFYLHSSAFVSLGGLTDTRVTGLSLGTRGAGIVMSLSWRLPPIKNLNVRSGFRYSVLEGSPNKFSNASEQLSVHAFGLINGLEWFL